jgi:hypothetical protein
MQAKGKTSRVDSCARRRSIRRVHQLLSVAFVAGVALTPSVADAAACTAANVAALMVQDQQTVALSCSGTLTLPPGATITRRLEIVGPGANGLRVECNGAVFDARARPVETDMIVVRSQQSGSVWLPVTDVTISGCTVYGGVRVHGIGRNANDDTFGATSPFSDHVQHARSTAPSRINLVDMELNFDRRIPFYVATGATHVTLRGSTIRGDGDAPAIYLDAETGYNTIENNDIQMGSNRELIAIDASSDNRIFGNYLSGLGNGGIFLYRNCGESRTIRHTTPSRNQIINNIFYYTPGTNAAPAVLVGSRNGQGVHYCSSDLDMFPGATIGSAGSNLDYATHNVVMQNQFYHVDPSNMIRNGRATDLPLYVAHNETVQSAVSRPTGCYVPSGFEDFVHHGSSADALRPDVALPQGIRYGCADGVLIANQNISLHTVGFECRAYSSNNGCSTFARCPTGTYGVGARVACNLEVGAVSDSEMASVLPGDISIVRVSDVPDDGVCLFGATSVSAGVNRVVAGRSTTYIGHCREYDANGGECHIRGQMYCY